MNWYKLTPDTSGYVKVVSDPKNKIHSNGSLSIVDVQKEDIGTYMAEISNSAGTATEEIQVELLPQAGL